MYTYEDAVTYFETEVLHNSVWVEADEDMRKRALKNAENELYSFFTSYSREEKPLPVKAIYEQALWLMRQDDTTKKAELGVTNVNLSGEISISMSGTAKAISPTVFRIVRKSRKVGRYV
jgi:hypothetical protein